MKNIAGLFKRGNSYYVRIVLPKDHPLILKHSNGRYIKSLGSGNLKEAKQLALIKRAEILGNYVALGKNSAPIFIRDLFDRWAVASPRSNDTKLTCERSVKLFEKFFGNIPINRLERQQGDKFRSWLLNQPTTSKTARDRLNWIKAVLNFGVVELELLERNPWHKLDIKHKPTNPRGLWTEEYLERLFNHDIWTKKIFPKDRKAGGQASYWIPLLGLYTGARCSEICQLSSENIRTINGILIFEITDDGEEQQLKSESAKRIVPVHSKLIELGFLDYVANLKTDNLWPELPTRKGKAGGFFSQYFGTLRKELGIPRNIVFHSFRHNFRTSLSQANVSEITIDKLLGHSSTGSIGAKVYTHTYTTMYIYVGFLSLPLA